MACPAKNPETGKTNQGSSRRQFMREGTRAAAMAGVGALVGGMALKSSASNTLWQIDPYKCTWCGKCATECVLQPSAVKCVQLHPMCGYCKLCTGYFEPEPNALNTGAENQVCPTGAIKRTALEDPYYEYKIDEPLCIGCAKCVKGCTLFGNGSFFLQIRHDRCVNCNECSIAVVCPPQAIQRVPVNQPYKFKNREGGGAVEAAAKEKS
jgi:Na+-translocating ferredoxin:NAD+ oxidoreductase subunit B